MIVASAKSAPVLLSFLFFLLFDFAGVGPEPAYIAALWVPVIASALAAELATSPIRRRTRGNRRNDDADRVHLLVRGPAR